MKALLLTLAIIFAGTAHAFEFRSLANTCMGGDGKTYMCSEAFTNAENLLEAGVFSGGEVRVTGRFTGPGYFVLLEANPMIFWWWHPSWMARVVMPLNCAYSGANAAEGHHSAFGHNQGMPLPTWGPEESADFYVRFACDCDGEIP